MDLAGNFEAVRLRLLSYVIGMFEFADNAHINLRAKYGWGGRVRSQPTVPLDGKVCIITGANAGIGAATAAEMVARGAHVIMACRSLQRGKLAAEAASVVVPKEGCKKGAAEVAQLDLGSLESVRQFAADFNRRNETLDLLVCNAGIMAPLDRHETVDGLEEQFQVNYLGHWLLTHELMVHQRQLRQKVGPARAVSNQEEGDIGEGTRVLFLSSMAHLGASLDFRDLQLKHRYAGYHGYANSKLGAVLAAREYQKRFDRNGPQGGRQDTAVSVHPGLIDTELARGWMMQGDVLGKFLLPVVNAVMRPLMPWILLPVEHAVTTVMYAATAPAREVRGRYVADARVARPSRQGENDKLAAQLWDVSCQLTGITSSPTLELS